MPMSDFESRFRVLSFSASNTANYWYNTVGNSYEKASAIAMGKDDNEVIVGGSGNHWPGNTM